MTPSSSTPAVKTTMSLRKGATFHSPSSPTDFKTPSLPRRSQTNLEDVVEAHKRRVALTLGDIDRSLDSLGLESSPTQSFRDEAIPVPSGFLNNTVNTRYRDTMTSPSSDGSDYTVGGRSLRPRRTVRRNNLHTSDSGLGSSLHSGSEKRSVSTGLTSMIEGVSKTTVSSSAITRSAAAHPSTLENLPRLSERASNRIHEFIVRPILSKASLKDFHPLIETIPQQINKKEIVCLRDLEKTLIFRAPVSELDSDVERGVAHWFSRCLKERAKTAKLYLDFCLTSIRCIQATVEFLNEREQTRPHDRPYTNGYFVDLVEQIRSYAQQVQASKEKEANGESLDELDAEPYVPPPQEAPAQCTLFGSPMKEVTHVLTYIEFLRTHSTTSMFLKYWMLTFVFRSDEVKLYGGLSRNGRPAELVRVKKNGKAISIATGQPIKMESIEEDEKGGVKVKRSMSEELADEESILRSMARRKRSASAAELAPKRCREPNCTKEFKRSCDLTKHEKTHSRPWKCPEHGCKYEEYGWPTEKELDRHINDKHSSSPVLYKCHYAPCPYKSKRESNCKQHMEKSHGWTYVRSKNNGKNRSKNGDSSLPTPQTANHRTPESENILTPDEDDFEMPEAHNGSIGFDQRVYNDVAEFPEHTYDPNDFDFNNMATFMSPVDSNNHNNSMSSSAGTSPFMVDNTNVFQPITNVDVNFGPNFGNGNDFMLYGDEDIYNAHARVQIPTPTESMIFQPNLDAYVNTAPIKTDNIPHISPGGHGNTMLYTPTSLNAVDESFEYEPDNGMGQDFQLFASTNTGLSGIGQGASQFREAPSAVGGFSQPNTQEFFQAFYNHQTTTGQDWLANEEGPSMTWQ